MPLLIQKDRSLLNAKSNPKIISVWFIINLKINSDGPAKLIPKILRVPKLRQIYPINDLSHIGLILNFILLFDLLDVGLMEMYAVWIAVFYKV
jgi:hypothetical protein